MALPPPVLPMLPAMVSIWFAAPPAALIVRAVPLRSMLPVSVRLLPAAVVNVRDDGLKVLEPQVMEFPEPGVRLIVATPAAVIWKPTAPPVIWNWLAPAPTVKLSVTGA